MESVGVVEEDVLAEGCGGRRRAVATPNRESRKEKKIRISKLMKQRTENLKKLKKPKVQLDLTKEDFSEDFQNLFNDIPIVKHEKTFKNVTSNYIIDNIKENTVIHLIFLSIKETVRKIVIYFKENDTTKTKINYHI